MSLFTGPRVVGATKFKGFIILVTKFEGFDGREWFRGIAKLKDRVTAQSTLEYRHGDLMAGDYPTCRCAILAGKMSVDEELGRCT